MRDTYIKQVIKEVRAKLKHKMSSYTVEVKDYGARFKLVVTQDNIGFRSFGYFTLGYQDALDSVLMEYSLHEQK